MMQILIINELTKVLKRKRTYISFLLIGILIPFIVGAISNGGTTLEKSIYGQLSDSFFFIGSLLNGYLATYIIIAVLINHMPFLSTIIASDIFSGKVLKASIIRPRSLGFFPDAFAKAKVNNIKATNWVVKHLVEATPIS